MLTSVSKISIISTESLKNVSSKISLSKGDYENTPFIHVEQAIWFLRLDFVNSDGWARKINNAITGIFLISSMYYLGFMAKTMFYKSSFYVLDMSLQLLSMIWHFESILSMIFLVYWQYSGQLESLKAKLEICQNFQGLRSKTRKFYDGARWFIILYVITTLFNVVYSGKYYFEKSHSVWALQISEMFYYKELRFIMSIISSYMYSVWLTTTYVFVTYANAAYFEISFFNKEIRNLAGTRAYIKGELIKKVETFRLLSEAITELDSVFRLYTFAMLATVIPILIFTLMMLNQHLSSFTDFLICMPFILFCTCAFCSVTIAPARVHEECQNLKHSLCRNSNIWQPYDVEVYQLATTLASHCEQDGLGISIWGFATLSRPLILGTLSATAMMMSLLTDLKPERIVEVEVEA
ncbi:Gustatory receptor [Caenorhabditis elegans]|uniref:Gustatory receptor n=1 Tax=Caenorhabditis elegans TaxID=6239 RepID=Q23553_CAEEL|nr:Gustatory receptor [Caenorhabditis elegans]CCD68004.1 Gustatory receptor [Caenorhabditis elegans]|eukprot:NP_494992.2 GUstatory Receptor family [Caenorhabditis elegans]